MERLVQNSKRKKGAKLPNFTRYLFETIDWNQRLILILGHRGTGKTTLMLQRMQQLEDKSIFLSLDDYFFEEVRLATFVEQLYAQGVRTFFLDEVHRYLNWSSDLKILVDAYSDAFFVVSGSSVLALEKGKADLSRRAAVYHLEGLSFREFLNLELGTNFPKYSLNEILTQHSNLAEPLVDQQDILSHFEQYLTFGYYPFYRESKSLYPTRLLEITNLVLEIDLAPFEELSYKTVRSMKKLLYILSESVPFIPNISKLAERLHTSRNTVLKTFDLLEQAKLLLLLRQQTQGVSFLQKPEKIYLHNPNLAFAFSNQVPNRGNLRETFFFNQLQVHHEVSLPKQGDFMLDHSYVIEVGGAHKGNQQLVGIPNAFVAADGIKTGSGNKIPLWLFGFLY
jgi:predicted AAA+ superfamily ATPase